MHPIQGIERLYVAPIRCPGISKTMLSRHGSKLGAPAEQSTLVWGPWVARPPIEADLFDRILVAVTDDAAADAAVLAAAVLATIRGSEVLAIHVSCHDVPRLGPQAADCGLREQDASLERALSQLRKAGVRCRGECWQAVDGRVLQSLLQAADEGDASLLIVGGCRPNGLRGRLTGGLALRLAANTSRSVLIVR